ncbi:hypothetical protein RB595_009966 [Gaeumannomyces hyphopodioides]
MTSEADAIAAAVLDEFDKLPNKRKPPIRGNGIHEWVPLSGIVARGGSTSSYICLSLATGMKCLPASKVPHAKGLILHDWHAEILAIRAFNHFVLEECRSLAMGLCASEYLRVRSAEEIAQTNSDGWWSGQPFAWKEDVSLHMYCSEAPCGDASMELVMATQEDSTPWEVPCGSGSSSPAEGSSDLPGRAYFSRLGVVRRKPARGDAPQTLSKSCSDKLAMSQCASLLSSLTSLLVSPRGVYLRTLVLPESQHSEEGCRRSFSADGRMRDVAAAAAGHHHHHRPWPGGYGFHPFDVRATSPGVDFDFSRRRAAARTPLGSAGIAPSPQAMAWNRAGLEEGVMAGVQQGRKQTDPKGASVLCRAGMWGRALSVASSAALLGAGAVAVRKVLSEAAIYKELKQSELIQSRAHVKEQVKATGLRGWVSSG